MQKQETKEVSYELDAVTKNTDGEEVANSTLKDRTIMCLASLVYENEELLSKALDYCMKDGNQRLSMEVYVEDNFGTLLSKFPQLQKEYISSIRVKNAKAKKLRKKRRKKKR